jgi:hypothetical protein
VPLGQGKKVAEAVKALGVSEVTYPTSCSTARSSTDCADEPRSGSTRSWSVQGEALDGRRHDNAVRPHLALGYRPPPGPSRDRGRHGSHHDRPLAKPPMSCITDAAPGPARRGGSVRAEP